MYFIVHDESVTSPPIEKVKYSRVVKLARDFFAADGVDVDAPGVTQYGNDINGKSEFYDLPWLYVPKDHVQNMRLFVNYMDGGILEATPIYVPELDRTLKTVKQTMIAILYFAEFVEELGSVKYNNSMFKEPPTPGIAPTWYIGHAAIVTHVFGDIPHMYLYSAIVSGRVHADDVSVFECLDKRAIGEVGYSDVIMSLTSLISLKTYCPSRSKVGAGPSGFLPPIHVESYIKDKPALRTLELHGSEGLTLGDYVPGRRSYGKQLVDVRLYGIEIVSDAILNEFVCLEKLHLVTCDVKKLDLRKTSVKSLVLDGVDLHDLYALPSGICKLTIQSCGVRTLKESIWNDCEHLEELNVLDTKGFILSLTRPLPSLRSLTVRNISSFHASANVTSKLKQLTLDKVIGLGYKWFVNSPPPLELESAKFDKIGAYDEKFLASAVNLKILHVSNDYVLLPLESLLSLEELVTVNCHSWSRRYVEHDLSNHTQLKKLVISGIPVAKFPTTCVETLCVENLDMDIGPALSDTIGVIEAKFKNVIISRLPDWKTTLRRIDVMKCKSFNPSMLKGYTALVHVTINEQFRSDLVSRGGARV